MDATDFFRHCINTETKEVSALLGFKVEELTRHDVFIPNLPQRFRWRGYPGEIVLKGKRIYCILRTPEPLVVYVKPVQIKAYLPSIRFVDYCSIEGAVWLRKPMVSYTKVALYT